MSANGRLLAFSQELTKPIPHSKGAFSILGYQVHVLATGAPPGTVAARSRVVARFSTKVSAFSPPTVLLSPAGTSFYLCSQPWAMGKPGTNRVTETATISTYRTATGKATGVLADWTASYVQNNNGGDTPLTLGCSTMALDPSGRYLLVPYRETAGNPYQSTSGSVTVARITIATGAKSGWTIPDGTGQGQDTMSIAW